MIVSYQATSYNINVLKLHLLHSEMGIGLVIHLADPCKHRLIICMANYTTVHVQRKVTVLRRGGGELLIG